jgi:hypothetical protein
VEVVVHHRSRWQDMIPPLGYQEFKGEASEDPEKHLFICEKIWEEKKITDEDTKLAVSYHAKRPRTGLVHELSCKQSTRNNKDDCRCQEATDK